MIDRLIFVIEFLSASFLQLSFEVANDLKGLFILILLDDDVFILLIDDFDCPLYFIIEVESKSSNGIFNLCDLSHPEINEVSVVCFLYLFTIKLDFIVQKHLKLPLKLGDLFSI
jgi:hypothetical protein